MSFRQYRHGGDAAGRIEASSGRFSRISSCWRHARVHAWSFCWYWVGRLVGVERLKGFSARHGHWLTLIRPVDRADQWFDRHGAPAVMVARVVPVVRIFISVPAGYSRWIGAGSSCSRRLATHLDQPADPAGYLLRTRYEQVAAYLNPVSTVVLTICLGPTSSARLLEQEAITQSSTCR